MNVSYNSTDIAAGDPPESPDFCRRCHHVFGEADLAGENSVIDAAGREYDYHIDTQPGTEIYCPECYRVEQTETRAENNHGLTEFGGEQ